MQEMMVVPNIKGQNKLRLMGEENKPDLLSLILSFLTLSAELSVQLFSNSCYSLARRA